MYVQSILLKCNSTSVSKGVAAREPHTSMPAALDEFLKSTALGGVAARGPLTSMPVALDEFLKSKALKKNSSSGTGMLVRFSGGHGKTDDYCRIVRPQNFDPDEEHCTVSIQPSVLISSTIENPHSAHPLPHLSCSMPASKSPGGSSSVPISSTKGALLAPLAAPLYDLSSATSFQ